MNRTILNSNIRLESGSPSLSKEGKSVCFPFKWYTPVTVLLAVLFATALIAQPAETEKKLNDTIDRVIHQKQYQWRLPRGRFEPPKNSFLNLAFQKVDQFVTSMIKAILRWLSELRDWLNRRFSRGSSNENGAFSGNEKMLLYLLGGAVALLLLLVFFKFRKRQKNPQSIAAHPVVPLPDLTRDDVLASQLPEEEWLKMSAELSSRGELRLAMRALYMAGLASLANRQLLTIAKFKSNREYQMELRRRAHSYPQVLRSFSENVLLLERSWYGNHPVTPDAFDRFRTNQQQMSREATT